MNTHYTHYSAGTWSKTQQEHRNATKANKKLDEETQRIGKEMLKKVVLIPVGSRTKKITSTSETTTTTTSTSESETTSI